MDVPLRFRNAPTRLMKELGPGAGTGTRTTSRTPSLPASVICRTRCRIGDTTDPLPRGLEIKIAEALARVRARGPRIESGVIRAIGPGSRRPVPSFRVSA